MLPRRWACWLRRSASETARAERAPASWAAAARAADARLSALLPYLLAVGAAVVVPPVAAGDLRRLYEMLLPLVPTD